MTWKKQFKDEFGIHFKGCKGELGFAIQFIEDLRKAALAKQKEEILKALPEEPALPLGTSHIGGEHISEISWKLCLSQVREAIEKV